MNARSDSGRHEPADAPPATQTRPLVDAQRRQLLIGSSATLAAAAIGLPGPVAAATRGTSPDVHIELRAEPDRVAMRPGASTRVWRYRGRLLRGDPGSFVASAGGHLGPIIRVRTGQRLRVDLINGLPESTIVHWHGLHVPDDMDGHPRFAIAPGARYEYDFTVKNRAGSYWFHPHPHGRTGKQVYAGLAGLFLVSDDEEAALGLPQGAQDLPLVLQDRSFDAENQLVYLGDAGGGGMMGRRGMGSMMARMMGVLGDQILVNGSLQARHAVERQAYRLRLLNGSNTRTYKLAWDDETPLTVIANDGGLLAAPVQRRYLMLAPAERADLWVDFGHWPTGTERSLRSLAFEGGVGMGGMMGGMMGGSGDLPDGAAFAVCSFTVGTQRASTAPLPQRLSQIAAPEPSLAVNAGRPKVFDLSMRMMAWGINGEGFDMLGASELETVRLGTQEIWEFRNEGRGSMMGMVMPHSMHVHGLQFRVLGRAVSDAHSDVYQTVQAGLVDEGWKDTVLVMPGERVRVLMRFADYAGLFLYHCHMLEHEDAGLMRNYRVEA